MTAMGSNSLAFSVLVAAAAVLAFAVAGRRQSVQALAFGRYLTYALAGLITLASVALCNAFMQSDFSVAYVASYSERALPSGYKFAAFWAGQEGSLLLWAWLLAVMSMAVVIQWRRQSLTEQATLGATMAVVTGFFAALMLFAADPFKTLPTPPADGHGLNPLLQDFGMIIHPPTLFVGYAGFTVPMAMLFAALVARRADNDWLGAARKWVLVSWVFLSVGIILGAQWAYIELGWGGYWAWDPVENASLLPWLTGTALLHSIMVQQQRSSFKVWNASLIVATFLLCIFGTFLTRSGVIDSVHAFPKSHVGQFFLVFLIVGTLGSVALLVWRRGQLRGAHKLERFMSKDGFFLLGNVLLVLMTLVTLVGTMFPLISGTLTGKSVSVGPEFYNKAVVPMILVLIALMVAAPLLSYGKDSGHRIARGLRTPAALAVIALIVAVVLGLRDPWALGCVLLATIGCSVVVNDVVSTARARSKHSGQNLPAAALSVVDANHRRYGGLLVHVGVILMMAGIAGSSLFGQEHALKVTPNETVAAGQYQLSMKPLREVRGPNYTAIEAVVHLTDPDGRVMVLAPQTRFYDKSQQPHTEIALNSDLARDVYVSLAGWEQGGKNAALKVLINPLAIWIWVGGVVLVIGGLLALLPRLLPRAAASPRGAGEPTQKDSVNATDNPQTKKQPLRGLVPQMAAARTETGS